MSGHVKDFPTVVIPFESSCESETCQDVCVYLRPETNGVQVESTMMRTIQATPLYRENVKLVYLANLPGEFISRRRIIEHHYRLKILFAKKGKRLFTEYMRREFSRYFKTDFEEARILGSFEAMKKLGFSREDLFNIWVDKKEILHLNGQTIKHFGEYYIINYDIPALLLKNRTNTDVAVMILRTTLGPKTVHTLMMDMVDALKRSGYLHESDNFTRVFHFSRSPFEQILDSIGFLYDAEGSHVALRKIRFYNYLLKKGIDALTIRKFLEYPVFGFENEKGRYFEETIYAATYGLGYEDAFRKLQTAKTQVLLD
ncbi:MAG: hypothetical protein K9L68_14970 [Spirochaetales bacterium]|nr:hypothetical protein [Spirochaetales bacterium]